MHWTNFLWTLYRLEIVQEWLMVHCSVFHESEEVHSQTGLDFGQIQMRKMMNFVEVVEDLVCAVRLSLVAEEEADHH